EGILAQRGTHPVVAGRGRVTFVENEVNHFENRRQPRRKIRPARNFKRNARLGESALGADDALGDGRLGNEESAGDFPGREAAEKTKRERDACFGGKHGVTRSEEHTSELQSHLNLVCRLLLEKKKHELL